MASSAMGRLFPASPATSGNGTKSKSGGKATFDQEFAGRGGFDLAEQVRG